MLKSIFDVILCNLYKEFANVDLGSEWMELKFLLLLMLVGYSIVILFLLCFARRIYHIENKLYEIENDRKILIKEIEDYRNEIFKLDLGLYQLERRTRNFREED